MKTLNIDSFKARMNELPHTNDMDLVVMKLTPDEDGVRDNIEEQIESLIEDLQSSCEYSVLLADYLLEYPDSDLQEFHCILEEMFVQRHLNDPDFAMHIAFWDDGEALALLNEKYIEKMYESDIGYCPAFEAISLDDTPGLDINVCDTSEDDWSYIDVEVISIACK